MFFESVNKHIIQVGKVIDMTPVTTLPGLIGWFWGRMRGRSISRLPPLERVSNRAALTPITRILAISMKRKGLLEI
jgi:hypothetical protein